jgi:hypothetical protein
MTVAFRIPLFIYGKSPGLPQRINFFKFKEADVRKSVVTLSVSFFMVASQKYGSTLWNLIYSPYFTCVRICIFKLTVNNERRKMAHKLRLITLHEICVNVSSSRVVK